MVLYTQVCVITQNQLFGFDWIVRHYIHIIIIIMIYFGNFFQLNPNQVTFLLCTNILLCNTESASSTIIQYS